MWDAAGDSEVRGAVGGEMGVCARGRGDRGKVTLLLFFSSISSSPISRLLLPLHLTLSACPPRSPTSSFATPLPPPPTPHHPLSTSLYTPCTLCPVHLFLSLHLPPHAPPTPPSPRALVCLLPLHRPHPPRRWELLVATVNCMVCAVALAREPAQRRLLDLHWRLRRKRLARLLGQWWSLLARAARRPPSRLTGRETLSQMSLMC